MTEGRITRSSLSPSSISNAISPRLHTQTYLFPAEQTVYPTMGNRFKTTYKKYNREELEFYQWMLDATRQLGEELPSRVKDHIQLDKKGQKVEYNMKGLFDLAKVISWRQIKVPDETFRLLLSVINDRTAISHSSNHVEWMKRNQTPDKKASYGY